MLTLFANLYSVLLPIITYHLFQSLLFICFPRISHRVCKHFAISMPTWLIPFDTQYYFLCFPTSFCAELLHFSYFSYIPCLFFENWFHIPKYNTLCLNPLQHYRSAHFSKNNYAARYDFSLYVSQYNFLNMRFRNSTLENFECQKTLFSWVFEYCCLLLYFGIQRV